MARPSKPNRYSLNASIGEQEEAALRFVAEEFCDNNRSFATRKLIRAGAERLGVDLSDLDSILSDLHEPSMASGQ